MDAYEAHPPRDNVHVLLVGTKQWDSMAVSGGTYQ